MPKWSLSKILGVYPLGGNEFMEVYHVEPPGLKPSVQPDAILYRQVRIDENGRTVISETYSEI